MFSVMQKKANTSNLSSNNLAGGDVIDEKEETYVLRDQLFDVLLFFSHNRDGGICEKALIALGNFKCFV